MSFRLTTLTLRTASRRFVSTTSRKQGGGHGHDDHAHHVHRVFEGPYNRTLIAGGFISVVALGIAIPSLSVGFQNRKHGFSK